MSRCSPARPGEYILPGAVCSWPSAQGLEPVAGGQRRCCPLSLAYLPLPADWPPPDREPGPPVPKREWIPLSLQSQLGVLLGSGTTEARPSSVDTTAHLPVPRYLISELPLAVLSVLPRYSSNYDFAPQPRSCCMHHHHHALIIPGLVIYSFRSFVFHSPFLRNNSHTSPASASRALSKIRPGDSVTRRFAICPSCPFNCRPLLQKSRLVVRAHSRITLPVAPPCSIFAGGLATLLFIISCCSSRTRICHTHTRTHTHSPPIDFTS